MKNLLRMAFLCWLRWKISEAKDGIDDFTSLAIGVQDFYKSPSVYVVYDRHIYGFDKQDTLMEILKSYSRRYRLSQVISYEDLGRVLLRPENILYALIIRDKENLEHAINATRDINISLHPWLLDFENVAFNCDKPGRDFFKLTMNTKMTAKCQGNNILKRYYGIYDYETEVVDLAVWTTEKKLKFKDRRSLVNAQTDMKGVTLKVANKILNPAIATKFNIYKFCMHVLDELKNLSNFKTEKGPEDDRLGYYDTKTQEWTGLMGVMAEKKADMGGALFTLSKTRMTAVDYVMPLIRGRCHLYARLPEYSEVLWDSYFQVFNRSAMIMSYASILIFAIVLCFMTKRLSIGDFSDNCIKVWGILTQQGLSDKPTSHSIQMAYVSILIWSLVMNSIYSACFISYVTVLTPKLPFDTYDDFKRDDSYLLAVVRGSRDYDLIKLSNDSLLAPLKYRLKKSCFLPTNSYEGFLQACNGQTAFYTNEFQYEGIKNKLPCELGSVKMERIEYSSFVLTKNSPYTKTLDYYIIRLKEFGIMKRLREMYFQKLTELSNPQAESIRLKEVSPLLAIWILGLIMASAILILEIVVFRYLHFTSANDEKFVHQRNDIRKVLMNEKRHVLWVQSS